MHEKMSQIGQDRSTQDPSKAMDAAHGTYEDVVDRLTPTQRYANLAMPSAPDPNPIGNLRKVGPGRSA